MRNMGTAASMSISILRDGELWGLISCHHGRPRVVPFEVRTACDFLGQVLSVQLAAKEHHARIRAEAVELKSAAMAGRTSRAGRRTPRWPPGGRRSCDGLREPAPEASCSPVAAGAGGRRSSSDRLAAPCSGPRRPSPRCRGLVDLGSKLHRGYVLWFRPEESEPWTAGDPAASDPVPSRPATAGDPRAASLGKSFEAWKEIVRAPVADPPGVPARSRPPPSCATPSSGSSSARPRSWPS